MFIHICLALKNIANNKSASKFKALADGFSHIKKITAKVAVMIKFLYDEFQNIDLEKQSEFVAFDFVKDWLDIFLGKYISDKKSCGIFVD